MNRAALEHILRAASAIANEREFVVIGSQAILGQYPDAPESLLVSIEADLYPRHAPERSDLVDAAIGELSEVRAASGRPDPAASSAPDAAGGARVGRASCRPACRAQLLPTATAPGRRSLVRF
jgi:hypothetical protein